MSEKSSEKSNMSSVEFVQDTLRNRVAPPGVGVNVSDRIRTAARRLGWSYSRTRDAWYADPRISINADEMRAIEEHAGVRYGRREVKEIDAYIARASALLEGPDPDFHRPFIAALRAFFGAVAGPGTE